MTAKGVRSGGGEAAELDRLGGVGAGFGGAWRRWGLKIADQPDIGV